MLQTIRRNLRGVSFMRINIVLFSLAAGTEICAIFTHSAQDPTEKACLSSRGSSAVWYCPEFEITYPSIASIFGLVAVFCVNPAAGLYVASIYLLRCFLKYTRWIEIFSRFIREFSENWIF
jgi:hypothetical protein